MIGKMENSVSRMAIFDLDYTLLDADSEKMWSNFMYAKKIVDKGFVLRIIDYYQAYEKGELDIVEYESFLLAPLTQHPVEKLFKLRKQYLNQIRNVVRMNMLQRAHRFRSQGFTLLLITAANSFIAEPIAEMLHFDNVICTQVRKKGDQFTNELDGIPAFREGKVQLLEQWLVEHQMDLAGSWGYSDSYNDLPLLSKVENPVAVFPDPLLLSHALQNGWKVVTG